MRKSWFHVSIIKIFMLPQVDVALLKSLILIVRFKLPKGFSRLNCKSSRVEITKITFRDILARHRSYRLEGYRSKLGFSKLAELDIGQLSWGSAISLGCACLVYLWLWLRPSHASVGTGSAATKWSMKRKIEDALGMRSVSQSSQHFLF